MGIYCLASVSFMSRRQEFIFATGIGELMREESEQDSQIYCEETPITDMPAILLPIYYWVPVISLSQ